MAHTSGDSRTTLCSHCGLPMPAPAGTVGGEGAEGFCCFGCRFAHQIALPSLESEGGEGPASGNPPSTLLLRLGLGIFLAFNIMAVNGVFYSREFFGQAAEAGAGYSSLTELFAYLTFFLATAVLALLGIPLLSSVLAPGPAPEGAGRHRRRLGSSHLILLGVFSAYALSAYNTFRGEGSLYFDTAAMVLVAVTVGSFIEGRAKLRAARSATSLHRSLPETVLVRRGGEALELRAEDLSPGDEVRILPGETLPVDGAVTEGRSRVDEASLTGEARPRTVEAGSALLAGTVNLEGQLWARTERVGTETVLAQTERSLEEARAQQPAIQRMADRVAGIFAPAVMVLALAVFAWQVAIGRPGEGLLRGLSVLLISCPCALGLAAPLASWQALKRAAFQGILVDSAVTLERAAVVDRLFFDKTGTLTEPELDLSAVVTVPDLDAGQALAWAARLEAASPHPIARAFLRREAEGRESRQSSILAPASEARVVPGRGVEGVVGEGPGAEPGADFLRLRLGSGTWVRESGLSGTGLPDAAGAGPHPGPGGESSGGTVYLFSEDQVLARFELVERLRPGAGETVRRLELLGIRSAILSGDSVAAAAAVGEPLGIASQGALLPVDKVEHLQESREQSGGRIAMVGDGLNDAPVLAAADLGVAVGSASDLARRSASVRLVEDRLDRLPILFEIARDCRRRIRLNLTFSFAFNSVGIGLATAGLLNPIFAAVAMVLSSLLVVRISSGSGRIPLPEEVGETSHRAATIYPKETQRPLLERVAP